MSHRETRAVGNIDWTRDWGQYFKDIAMENGEQSQDDQESARSHRASIEIAETLAKMFTDLKPKIMAKYSIEDEQVILLAIAKAAVKLGTNSMRAGSLTREQTEELERKLQSVMLNAFMFGEVGDE